MGRREKVFLSVTIALIVLLSTFMALNALSSDSGGAKRIPVYVIGGEARLWRDFELGVNAAATQYNVDARVTILASAGELPQALQAQADAFVIAVANDSPDKVDLEETGCPVLMVGKSANYTGDDVAARLGVSEQDYGAKLGEQVAASKLADGGVLFFASNPKQQSLRQAGFLGALDARGITYETITRDESLTVSEQIGSRKPKLLCALESDIVEELCAYALGTSDYYVMGTDYSGLALQALAEGRALCLVVYNQYGLGYSAIELAMQAAEGGKIPSPKSRILVATPENMSGELAPVLFPEF